MSAIEVLKREKELYVKQILEIEEANQSRPTDIAKMYDKSIKTLKEFINALDDALLALEKKENDRKQGAVEELELVKSFIESNKCCNDLNCDGALKSEEAISFINKRLVELQGDGKHD